MNILEFIVYKSMSIKESMFKINKNGHGIVFLCNASNQLLAVISDGDIRRYIMNGGDLDKDIGCVANYVPYYVHVNENINIKHYLKEKSINAIPIVDDKKEIKEIYFSNGNKAVKINKLDIPVVIMAGGKGTRLSPYTQVLPKPLIPIGEKTITEHILDHFLQYSCTNIYMIVNYKKHFIKTYFHDIDMSYNINFIDEDEFFGTAGGLRLLIPYINKTFFMTNCDILVEAIYSEIYDEHKRNNNLITIVCAEKELEIPYGIINANKDNQVLELKEKPQYNFLTNTGFYIIEPRFLNKIPSNTYIHITDVISQCIKEGERVGVYKIPENSWMDMGQINELKKMQARLSE